MFVSFKFNHYLMLELERKCWKLKSSHICNELVCVCIIFLRGALSAMSEIFICSPSFMLLRLCVLTLLMLLPEVLAGILMGIFILQKKCLITAAATSKAALIPLPSLI